MIRTSQKSLDEPAAFLPSGFANSERNPAESLGLRDIEECADLQAFGAESSVQRDIVGIRIAAALPRTCDAISHRDEGPGIGTKRNGLRELCVPVRGRCHRIMIEKNCPRVGGE